MANLANNTPKTSPPACHGPSPTFAPPPPPPVVSYSPASPGYSPSSPCYACAEYTSRQMSYASPCYYPSVTLYSPANPGFPTGGRIPAYVPTSPRFSPTGSRCVTPAYVPTSPQCSPDNSDEKCDNKPSAEENGSKQ